MQSIVADLFMLYAVAGFYLIIIAPIWRIFKKADQPGWQAIIPGFNIIKYSHINNLSLLYIMPFVSIFCILVYMFFIGMVDAFVFFILQPDTLVLLWILRILFSLFLIAVLTDLFFFPCLSLIMLALILATHSLIPKEANIIILPLMLALFVLQLAADAIYWFIMLKRLKRYFWETGILFLTFIPLFILALFNVFNLETTLFWQIALGVGSLFTILISFVYLYFLGYSIKIKYTAS